jgi:hypothetical protein
MTNYHYSIIGGGMTAAAGADSIHEIDSTGGIGSAEPAGDVASFHSPSLGTRIRVEHQDNANSMGRSAGRNMAGTNEPYNHLPSFYSDMFDLGYEAVGEVDSRLEKFVDWKRPNEEGVVY